jgi:ribonuclease P protein component
MSTANEEQVPRRARAEAFPRALRLRRRSDFRRVQDHGRKVHTGHFILFATECAEGTQRLGITVTRKTGNAVVRNRLKRYVRETWRRHRDAFPRGLEIVVLIKRGMQDLDSHSVETELLRASQRL